LTIDQLFVWMAGLHRKQQLIITQFITFFS